MAFCRRGERDLVKTPSLIAMKLKLHFHLQLRESRQPSLRLKVADKKDALKLRGLS